MDKHKEELSYFKLRLPELLVTINAPLKILFIICIIQIIGLDRIFQWHKCVDLCMTKVLQNNSNAKGWWDALK